MRRSRELSVLGACALFSLAAILTSFHTTSNACGWVPPRLAVHSVTTHSVLLADSAWRQRTFVVLGDAPKIADGHWQALAPMTYDNTRIAELSALPSARVLTLVGPTGTRVVSADHQVALEGGWQLGQGPHAALEVPGGETTIAIDGKLPDAKWHAMHYTYSETQHIPDLGYDVTYADGGFTVRADGKLVTSGKGTVLGALDADHQRFLVIRPAGGEMAAVYVGATV